MKMTFNDIFIDNTKKGRKILKENYHNKGKVPIIDQGKNQISGFSDEKVGIYKKIPVIIFGDHTRIIKYVDYPFLLGADGVKILSIKTNKFIAKYLYYALLNYYIPDTGYNRHFKWLKNFTINVSSIDEQKRIVIILDKLVTIINKKKNQINLLEELVKSRFIEMFENKEYPIVLLGEISEVITKGTTPTTLGYNFENSGIKFIKIENIREDGKFNLKKVMYISEECNEKMKRSQLQKDDILFSIAGAIGKSAMITEELIPSNTNQALAIIRLLSNKKIDNRYILETLKSDYLKRQYNSLKQGIAQTNLSLKNIREFQIPLPTYNEQCEYSKFATKIDKLKFETEKSLKEMENLYESLMQKFFKQN